MITTKYWSAEYREFMEEVHNGCGGRFVEISNWDFSHPPGVFGTDSRIYQRCNLCNQKRVVQTDAGAKIQYQDIIPVAQKVEITKDGLRTYIEGEKYPRKGFPEYSLVEFALPAIKAIIPMVTGYGAKLARKLHIPPERYSRPVREIHRVMTLASSRATDKHMKDKIENVRDTICPVLELDDFYRNIFQDMISEIRIEELLPDEADKHFREEQREQYNFGGK